MYKSIASAYYRNSAGCIAMFDLTNLRSFQSLTQWVVDIHHAAPNARCIVVGNKTDIPEKRVVQSSIARAFATSVKAEYAETSVTDGKSVNNMFQMITTRIYDEQVKTMGGGETPPMDGITILRLPANPSPSKGRAACQCKQA